MWKDQQMEDLQDTVAINTRGTCRKIMNNTGLVMKQPSLEETLLGNDNWRFLLQYATVSPRYVQAAESLALSVP
jgi:hypothetical protein